MENTSNADNQSPDQSFGDSLKGLSPQNDNLPPNNDEEDITVYSGLGVKNDPDIMNPGSEEASDTLLYTDNVTARHATDELSNDEEPDEFTNDLANSDLSDDEIDEEITELAEEEDEGNERY
ncbi:hypothetical protein IC229_19890 [Spirosoma sp. BT702]|uniref:Uncharacterized protein n=1 Tax=Spirosoma profusum TaxID=2771354 RepID=A0A926Y2Z0_9BACT|nr:hypothetical protein [Spirosoma profusum]MBD2702918.1 hypothetical protein [Spirosoma profusum]